MADKNSQYDVRFSHASIDNKVNTKSERRLKLLETARDWGDVPPEQMTQTQLEAWEGREIKRIEPLLDEHNSLFEKMLKIREEIGQEWLFMLNDRHEEYYLKRLHPLHKGKDFLYYPVSWDIPNSRNQ